VKRTYLFTAAIVAAVLVLSAAGFFAFRSQTVSVRAGEIVECTYGHIVSEDIETVEVPQRDASNYSVTTRQIVCADHLRAQTLYDEAQEALEKADLKKAEKKLEEVLAIDSSFKQAKSQLAQINSGKKPQADGSSNDSSGDSNGKTVEKPDTPGDDKPSGPVASLAAWMPDALSGYKAEKAIADVFSISRDYTPASDTNVRVLVIAAEQYGSDDMAKSALEKSVRLPYNGKAIKVGKRSGYLGTNGDDVAVLGITDGAVRIIFQMTTKDEQATKVTSDLIKIAEGLPR